jgi:diketogulonate reductase-like aldo/keto reductase
MSYTLQIHAPVRTEKGAVRTAENYIPLDVSATWGAMEKLYDSGKARAIGVSNFSCKRMEDFFAVARVTPAVNQIESHRGWQQIKLCELCQSKGVHISVSCEHHNYTDSSPFFKAVLP